MWMSQFYSSGDEVIRYGVRQCEDLVELVVARRLEETREARKTVLKAIESRLRKLSRNLDFVEVPREQIKEFIDRGLETEKKYFAAGNRFVIYDLEKLKRAYQLFNFEVPEALETMIAQRSKA